MIRLDAAKQDGKQSCFPCSIRTDNGNTISLVDLKIDLIKQRFFSECFAKSADCQHKYYGSS